MKTTRWILILLGLIITPIWADEPPSSPTPEAWQALREQNTSLQQQVITLSQQVVQLRQSLAEVQTIDPSQLSKGMNQQGFLDFLFSGMGWLLLLGIALIVAAVAGLIWLLVPRTKPVSELATTPERPKHFPPDPVAFAEDPLRPAMEDSAFSEDLLEEAEEEDQNESDFDFNEDLLLESHEEDEDEESDELLLEEADEATDLDLDDDLVESEEDFTDKAVAFSQHDSDDDEFDFMNSPDAMPVRLDLARAYLEMADVEAVRETLQMVLDKGTAEQQAEAKEIILQAEAAEQK